MEEPGTVGRDTGDGRVLPETWRTRWTDPVRGLQVCRSTTSRMFPGELTVPDGTGETDYSGGVKERVMG